MQTFIEVKVVDMFVQCMYPMRRDALAASDCCRRSATTAVVHPDGVQTWRCEEHKGLVRGTERGPVLESIRRRVKSQTKNIGPDDDGSWARDEDFSIRRRVKPQTKNIGPDNDDSWARDEDL